MQADVWMSRCKRRGILILLNAALSKRKKTIQEHINNTHKVARPAIWDVSSPSQSMASRSLRPKPVVGTYFRAMMLEDDHDTKQGFSVSFESFLYVRHLIATLACASGEWTIVVPATKFAAEPS